MTKIEKGTDTPGTQIYAMQAVSAGEEPSTADHYSVGDQAWDGTSQGYLSLLVGASTGTAQN